MSSELQPDQIMARVAKAVEDKKKTHATLFSDVNCMYYPSDSLSIRSVGSSSELVLRKDGYILAILSICTRLSDTGTVETGISQLSEEEANRFVEWSVEPNPNALQSIIEGVISQYYPNCRIETLEEQGTRTLSIMLGSIEITRFVLRTTFQAETQGGITYITKEEILRTLGRTIHTSLLGKTQRS